jgi:hypothetical protein
MTCDIDATKKKKKVDIWTDQKDGKRARIHG